MLDVVCMWSWRSCWAAICCAQPKVGAVMMACCIGLADFVWRSMQRLAQQFTLVHAGMGLANGLLRHCFLKIADVLRQTYRLIASIARGCLRARCAGSGGGQLHVAGTPGA